ncbi:tetratricopeptide repeat protein [Salipiger mucosus]|uniref:tetratricopeptide repeat protein n=1 Tax=Salipiger mucosus TaxID=263378 RepID=UPI0018DE14A4|nr:tetratricopeptide repeat protein [Salipiger mucosus]
MSPFSAEAEDQGPTTGVDDFDRGVSYHHGLGSPVNHEIAESYYREAIEASDDTRAMNELAVLLLNEDTRKARSKEAFDLLRRAAALDNSSARFNLGLAHYYGFAGMDRTPPRGLDLIATAANQGNAKAQSFMTNYVATAAATEAETHAAVDDLLHGWANEGDVTYWEIASMGSGYSDLWHRFFETPLADKSVMLSDILAVESGCRECTSSDVNTVARKLNEIETWRERAAEQDNSAMFNLGLAYLKGEGAPKNLEEGARLIIRSAENGYVPSQYVLGKLYLEGRGIERNPGMAYAWFNIAAADEEGYREADWARAMRDWVTAYLPPEHVAAGQRWSTEWVAENAAD